MLASVILDQVGTLLNDMEPGNEHVRWTVPSLLGYLTEAIATCAQGKPSIFTVVDRLALGTGSTQQLPAQYSRLLDIHFNVNRDGSEGPNVLPGVYSLQQAFQKPGCRSDALVEVYSAYPGSERFFWVDPPIPKGLTYTPLVEALVVLVPQIVTSAAQPLYMPGSAPELYRAALVDWVLYRCYAEDQESATSFQRSTTYLQSFQSYLGIGAVQQQVQKSSGQPARRAA